MRASTAADVQPSNLAGSWYPASARELRSSIDELLDEAAAPKDAAIGALVVPHAAHRYSGRSAAAAYARIPANRWRRAVVLAPSHHHWFSGGALSTKRGFETPLGILPIEVDAVRRLADEPSFSATDAPFAREHAIEIELPFLQCVDATIGVVPVLVGSATRDFAALAVGLRSLDDGETLFVVSSDFTHYGASFDYLPFPPTDAATVAARLRDLDFGAIERVCAVDAEGFESYVAETGVTVCGHAPISAFLRSARPDVRGELASYSTSLDSTGDYEHSVSYAAILFRASGEDRRSSTFEEPRSASLGKPRA